jgi:glycosyltransferase involved in cell wall biosynthesis
MATISRVGMVLYGDLTFDSRVRREARTLALAGHDVSIACLADRSDGSDLPPNVRIVRLPPADSGTTPGAMNPFRARSRGRLAAAARGIGWLRRYVRDLRAWGPRAAAAIGPVDAWHAHDLTGLAAVGAIADRRAPVVYDVHDLILDTGTAVRLPGVLRRLLRSYERRQVARVAGIVTVNDGLRDVLRSRFPGTRIEVVHNTPDSWTPGEGVDPIRSHGDVPADAWVLLYHGGLSYGRGIEETMAALLEPAMPADVHLVLLGFGERGPEYRRLAGEPVYAGRVHVLDPVAPDELLTWVAAADLGVVLHPIQRLNDRNKTPNKLFECLAAGVPVVASDAPAMREIVLGDADAPLGVLADPSDPSDIARAVREVRDMAPAEAAALRARCRQAALDRWNWETESACLVRLYDDLGAPVTPG